MKKNYRKVYLVVLSDVHLGTYGCHAKELYKYLKSIRPKILILNGDIIDIWQFSKRYWPKSHMAVVKQILNLASKGTKVYYLTGNHDETLRKFNGLKLGNIQILNKMMINLDGKKLWFFHGDVFDVVIQYSKWLARLGSISYDALILLNVFVNKIAKLFGYEKVSLSKKVKNGVKSAVKYINSFEDTAAQVAIKRNYDHVICGHIHQPEDKIISNNEGKSIRYLNSGDWIENLTSLEYNKFEWRIYKYYEDPENFKDDSKPEDDDEIYLSSLKNKEIFNLMLAEFNTSL